MIVSNKFPKCSIFDSKIGRVALTSNIESKMPSLATTIDEGSAEEIIKRAKTLAVNDEPDNTYDLATRGYVLEKTADIDEKIKLIDEAIDRIEEIIEEITGVGGELDQIKESVARVNSTVTALSTKVTGHDEAIANLLSKIALIELQIVSLENRKFDKDYIKYYTEDEWKALTNNDKDYSRVPEGLIYIYEETEEPTPTTDGHYLDTDAKILIVSNESVVENSVLVLDKDYTDADDSILTLISTDTPVVARKSHVDGTSLLLKFSENITVDDSILTFSSDDSITVGNILKIYGAGQNIPEPEPEPVTYTISVNYTNCFGSNDATLIQEGATYNNVITAYDGYELESVVVTIADRTFTFGDGRIILTGVDGNIIVRANAVVEGTETLDELDETNHILKLGTRNKVIGEELLLGDTTYYDSENKTLILNYYSPYPGYKNDWLYGNILVLSRSASYNVATQIVTLADSAILRNNEIIFGNGSSTTGYATLDTVNKLLKLGDTAETVNSVLWFGTSDSVSNGKLIIATQSNVNTGNTETEDESMDDEDSTVYASLNSANHMLNLGNIAEVVEEILEFDENSSVSNNELDIASNNS